MIILFIIVVVIAVVLILILSSRNQAMREVAELGGLRTIFYNLNEALLMKNYDFYRDLGSSVEYKKSVDDSSFLKFIIRKNIDLQKPYEIQAYKIVSGHIKNQSLAGYILPDHTIDRFAEIIDEMEYPINPQKYFEFNTKPNEEKELIELKPKTVSQLRLESKPKKTKAVTKKEKEEAEKAANKIHAWIFLGDYSKKLEESLRAQLDETVEYTSKLEDTPINSIYFMSTAANFSEAMKKSYSDLKCQYENLNREFPLTKDEFYKLINGVVEEVLGDYLHFPPKQTDDEFDL